MVRMPHGSALALAFSLCPASQAIVLRTADEQSSAPAIPTNKEIKEKWDKMDEFLEIMFTMACKWKHGKDVHGAAVEFGKTSDNGAGGKMIDAQAVNAYKEELRQKNVQQLNSACGMIVGNGKGRCQAGCGDRWGDAMAKRVACSDKCTAAYANFETSCKSKAANLQQVYDMKLKMAKSRETCYEGHCAGIPTVWMKADEAAMTSEVDTQCGNQCTPAAIETKCKRKWQLEVDFLRGNVTQKCHDDSIVTSCFDTEKGTAKTAYDTCKSTDEGTCDTQFTECKTKGKVDSPGAPASAKEFCQQRKTTCTEQVTKRCDKEFKAALDKAQTKCESEAKTGEDTCIDLGLTAKETEVTDKCKTAQGTKCPEDCKKSCKVTEMNACLANLSDGDDPAEAFCSDFWQLLHESSEEAGRAPASSKAAGDAPQVDPVTGDPIVLLARK